MPKKLLVKKGKTFSSYKLKQFYKVWVFRSNWTASMVMYRLLSYCYLFQTFTVTFVFIVNLLYYTCIIVYYIFYDCISA